MKLPPVEYRAVRDVDEALAVLDAVGDEAAVLAGGQSLLLDLRYGRRSAGVLVDVNRIPALAGADGGAGSDGDAPLRIGALVRHDELEHRDAVDPLSRLLRRIAPLIGHPPIRARGTFVGSTAWAHPATEWCAAARALGAEVVLQSQAEGTRVVPGAEWFTGPGRTARRAGELITEVRLPVLAAGTGVGFAEHRRTSASFALVAALAAVRFEGGRISSAAVGLAGAAEVPLSADAAVAVLVGSDGSVEAVEEAATVAARDSDPHAEPHCSAEYRRHVVRVLVRRAVGEAVTDARAEAA